MGTENQQILPFVSDSLPPAENEEGFTNEMVQGNRRQIIIPEKRFRNLSHGNIRVARSSRKGLVSETESTPRQNIALNTENQGNTSVPETESAQIRTIAGDQEIRGENAISESLLHVRQVSRNVTFRAGIDRVVDGVDPLGDHPPGYYDVPPTSTYPSAPRILITPAEISEE